MKQEEIVEILTKTGCLNEDGCDKPVINSMKLLEDPIVTNRLAVELLQQLPNDTKLDTILCLHNDEMLIQLQRRHGLALFLQKLPMERFPSLMAQMLLKATRF